VLVAVERLSPFTVSENTADKHGPHLSISPSINRLVVQVGRVARFFADHDKPRAHLLWPKP